MGNKKNHSQQCNTHSTTQKKFIPRNATKKKKKNQIEVTSAPMSFFAFYKKRPTNKSTHTHTNQSRNNMLL